jgi:DNA-binding beta-propeller fold protein YncE
MNMIRTRSLIAVLIAAVTCTGCAIIAGQDDAGLPGQDEKNIRLNYVETLRNQASLRGESFRDVDYSAGTPTTLQQPNSVYADAFRVYVTDQAQPARVFIFDRGDRTASILAIPAPPADGKLLNPTGITVDSGNVILVADAQQGRVFGYDRNGTLLLTFGKWGDLAYPMAIAIDKRRNRIYIADSHVHLVKAFTLLGDRVFDIGVEGPAETRLKSPVGLALDQEGRLYVLDNQSKRVQVYDPEGTYMRMIPLSSGIPGASLRPAGIAVDSAGHIYVADRVNNNILIFGSDGSFLRTWGKTGNLNGDFWTPQGLFIDERDHIYIADQTNGRVQVYQFQK